MFLGASLSVSTPGAQAQSEGMIGEIRMFTGNFAPQGWALCDGQLLQVNENDALFSLLGTLYGGDGRTTFGLPDLRGRVPTHTAQGQQGLKGGGETVVVDTEAGGAATTQSTVAVNYIICLYGVYPSRD